jgi:hypothetical protein
MSRSSGTEPRRSEGDRSAQQLGSTGCARCGQRASGYVHPDVPDAGRASGAPRKKVGGYRTRRQSNACLARPSAPMPSGMQPQGVPAWPGMSLTQR